ncbi:DinB family protein [Pseudonocardia humida]|uniref:DinB family protein n=1 Tax=Pseudonocardia humida TaxID=2800819 RepID=A0ABT0ZWC4_9PSEU|nr:DinB family protein [Pseudonocardia humida]MCO1655043.1 DinB family protein [Pseudonocardia humida]
MPGSRSDLLRRQLDLTWSLLEYHLDRLDPDDLLWEPAPLCWTVRPGPDGAWVPDWSDQELDPVPVPTGAWLTWHIGWWWGTALDHARGRPPRERTAVTWPGSTSGTVTWLRELHADWVVVLDELTDDALDAPAPFPWPPGSDRTVADMAAWVTAELMKNAAELGQLRLLRRVSVADPVTGPR